MLPDLRYSRHIWRRKFPTLDPFRTCAALVLNVNLSLGSSVGQCALLHLPLIDSSDSIIDNLTALLKRDGW